MGWLEPTHRIGTGDLSGHAWANCPGAFAATFALLGNRVDWMGYHLSRSSPSQVANRVAHLFLAFAASNAVNERGRLAAQSSR